MDFSTVLLKSRNDPGIMEKLWFHPYDVASSAFSFFSLLPSLSLSPNQYFFVPLFFSFSLLLHLLLWEKESLISASLLVLLPILLGKGRRLLFLTYSSVFPVIKIQASSFSGHWNTFFFLVSSSADFQFFTIPFLFNLLTFLGNLGFKEPLWNSQFWCIFLWFVPIFLPFLAWF